MTPRKRRLDYALRTPQRGIWLATAAILVLGIGAIYFATRTDDRGRLQMLERLAVGDSVTRVVELLGQPARRCATGTLEHLGQQFPPGWSPAARELAIVRLQAETARRWIYPVNPDREAGCGPEEGVTEIGLTAEQRVLWYVPIAGGRPLELPSGFTPEAVDTPDEETDG